MDPRGRSTCKLSFRLANLPAIQLLHEIELVSRILLQKLKNLEGEILVKISKAFPRRELKLEKFSFFFLFTREIVNLRVSPERIFTRFILRTVSIIPPLNVFLASTPRLLQGNCFN